MQNVNITFVPLYYVRKNNVETFEVPMLKAPLADPCCCIGTVLCPCVAQMVIRKKALKGDMTRYSCCQGYLDGVFCSCVPKAGHWGEQSFPMGYLCLESCCCNSLAMSATRFLVMDERRLTPDPWDNRIIRCNNFLQLLSCVCDILAICLAELRDFASILRCVAQCVYLTMAGCMTAQLNVELEKAKEQTIQDDVFHAPQNVQGMARP